MVQAVQAKEKSSDKADMVKGFNRLIAGSEVLNRDPTGTDDTGVLGLTPELVLKVSYDIDIHQLSTVEYIRQQASDIPIPDIHGILRETNSTRTFVFMSRVPGQPLDSVWTSLDKEQK